MHSSRSSSPDDICTSADWPVSKGAMAAARTFLREWYVVPAFAQPNHPDTPTHSAAASQPTLLLPDKDADGLCAGLILRTTLTTLGLAPTLLRAHFVAKGSNVHNPTERARIAELAPRPCFVIVADQGSRAGPPVLSHPHEGEVVRTLIVDHHLATGFPSGALVLSAAARAPVATSSTLAYLLCAPLVRSAGREVRERLEWLCVLGTMGDLGVSHKWEAPWPDMSHCAKRWTKKVLGDAVALVNARTCYRLFSPPERRADY